jgi:hypothetical protein
MDTVTVAKKIDELTMLVKQLAENIKQLSSAYSEILRTNVELRDFVKSGQFGSDFKEVIDFVRKIKVQQQPNVKVEEYVPDYPLIGALYQKQIIVGDVYRKKMRVDHARLIHAILTNKLSSIEKAVAVKLLSQRGGGSS